MDIAVDLTVRCCLCPRPASFGIRWQAGEVGGVAWVCRQHQSRQREACEASVRALLAPRAEAPARAGEGGRN